MTPVGLDGATGGPVVHDLTINKKVRHNKEKPLVRGGLPNIVLDPAPHGISDCRPKVSDVKIGKESRKP